MAWQQVKELLAQKMSDSDFALWIAPLKEVRHEEQILELTGPDPYFCNWVKANHLPAIEKAIQEVGLKGTRVRLSVGRPALPAPVPGEPERRNSQPRLPNMPLARSNVRTLHPRYTFEEFMVGESNVMAHAACEAIAQGDYSFPPCLYIEAGTGLGKSHLTHAVAHHITSQSPGTRLQYVTSQQLTAEMVRNIRNKTMEQFKEKYHHCDVLLMEDVQALAGKAKTQEELGEALDILLDSGKRLIFTGAVAPRAIQDIDEGVRSRISSGLITTINPPDRRTRCLIVERKARNNKLSLSAEVIEFLADRIHGDVRRVESAIIGIKAKASLRKTAPDLDLAREVVAELIGQRLDLNSVLIRDFVAGQFNLSIDDIQSKSRKKTVAFPRQVSMYLARKLTEEPLAEIGKAFGRDHSTVVHSIRVINQAIVRDGSIRGQVELLEKRLNKQR